MGRPLRPCGMGGCPELGQGSYCAEHESAARTRRERTYSATRDQEQFRFYGSQRWKRLRERVRAEEPLCRRCTAEGRTAPAEDVHHVDGDWRNNARANLEPICRRHHNELTRAGG